jgi:hypothetical protein
MKLIEELCSAIVEWCWVSWRWVHWQPQSTYGLEWTSVLACSIVPLGWDFVEGFTSFVDIHTSNVHVYQGTAWLFERLSNACALRHITLLVRAISPLSLSLRHLEALRMQSVYICALTLRFKTWNCRPCFKAGVWIFVVFYRFFLHNVRVIRFK